jgi:hypothetical protein
MAVFWDVAPMVLMMEAESASEKSISIYHIAWHSIPEICHIYAHRSENLKYHHANPHTLFLIQQIAYSYLLSPPKSNPLRPRRRGGNVL